ncbi:MULTISPECIES: hypothetical protein [Halopseudomonas]|jgi:hypothetical protein|uniref:Transmembrane protein n=1 Tax=Halopseudomonas aestusnigri TaxID=857252 RepID=A0AAQ1G434_9GAMM|nr:MULTISPECIES: hypothetical protein [Halopseudomonas]MAK72702.1 hypothetical protein [Pseudomonadales bacterium]MEE2800274.1 hypothetical protein [Pseudomonadota bacterium]MAY07031.1 hypothetical protein [Pseudomonadales bacterium]MDL2200052.1 hypothetical protein [Halopseudomonas aestusnigri]OWL90913.1 hypothetical protein B7O88_01010 [Halopseudomonas aestusnigri]|tara:strand:+ start:6458 stop:6874 length:417 start_codon:yes stop_codon:yes gene_type:complete
MRHGVLAFIAGFLAVFSFHQPALALLHAAGVVPFPAFSLEPVAPLAVPSVVSSAFWGGIWGIVLVLALARMGKPLVWLKAALFGGIVLTLVALLLVFPLKGYGLDWQLFAPRFAIGFILNALWGLGTLVYLRAFAQRA